MPPFKAPRIWPKVLLRFRGLMLLSCLFALLLASFTYTLYQQSKVTQERDDRVIESYEILRTARALYTNILNMETGQRGYLLTGNPQFLAPYEEGKTKVETGFQKLTYML